MMWVSVIDWVSQLLTFVLWIVLTYLVHAHH